MSEKKDSVPPKVRVPERKVGRPDEVRGYQLTPLPPKDQTNQGGQSGDKPSK